MSLQLWMPLTKDLRQQGVSGITPTQTTGYTSVAAGKLGGCYKFTGTFDTLLPLSNWNWTEGSVSFGCWAKISKTELAALVAVPSYTSTYKSMGGTLLGRDSYGGVSIRWETNNIYTDTTLNKIYVYTHMRNTSSATNQTGSYEVSFDTWFHVMTVIDRNDSIIKLYVNGELVKTVNITATGTFSTGTFRIAEATWHGGNGNSSAGCWQLNDVRVYDHALSQMEVKELAKGLVLHYSLGDKYIESTTNLITTEDCLSATCYNGATNKYSYGTTTDMYKTVTTFDGRKGTKVYMGTNGNSCFPYIYVNNMFTSDGTNQPAYKTLSFDYYTTISTSICPYKLGSGTGTATYIVSNKNGIQTGTGTNAVTIPVLPNAWNHIEITFHGTTSANSEWGYIQNQPTHTSNTSNFWFFANMQLEVKDHATGYAGVSGTRASTIAYDNSGFCNNGIIYKYDNDGDIIIDSDTPKYSVCTHIQAGSPTVSNATGLCYIYSNFALTTPNQLTISFWCKPIHNYQDSTSRQGVFCTTNDSIGINAGTDYNTTAMHHRDSSIDMCQNDGTWNNFSTPFVVGEWHHYTFLYNGKNMQWYKDGIFQSEKAFSNAGDLKSFTAIVIGFTKAGGVYRKNDCYISDFRVYATALSADDVKSLYQNCATIDPDGTIRGQIRS